MIALAYGVAVLVLANPQLDDKQLVGIKLTSKHTMNGAIHTFKYTEPSDQFSLTFRGIAYSKMLEVMAFLEYSSGQVIVYTDSKGINYNVKLKEDEIDFQVIDYNYNGQDVYEFTLLIEVV
jgi:hypothetical protein